VLTVYYTDDTTTLYLGDCLSDPDAWADCAVLVTDPPYGRQWRQGDTGRGQHRMGAHQGIHGDRDTTTRDRALAVWGNRPAILFGDLLMPCPHQTRQVLVYRKPPDAGTKGTYAGYRRDIEAIHLCGDWPAGHNGDTSVLASGARTIGNPVGLAARYGHPHAKPVDLMCHLIGRCPPGSVADPFAGSGSTLIAARMDGRRAIGVEIEERYCENAANRLSQSIMETS